MSKFYTRKPLIIEAIQLTEDNLKEVVEFCGKKWINKIAHPDGIYFIRTPEGDIPVALDYYFIKEAKGKIYPCKPDIFEASYKLT